MRIPAATALAGVAGVAVALVLWQVVSVGEVLDPTSFPPPTEVADALVGVVGESSFWTALGRPRRARCSACSSASRSGSRSVWRWA